MLPSSVSFVIGSCVTHIKVPGNGWAFIEASINTSLIIFQNKTLLLIDINVRMKKQTEGWLTLFVWLLRNRVDVFV